MSESRTPQAIPGGAHRPPTPRERVGALLFAPLPALNPPGFDSSQLAGLRSLPEPCIHLKLVYALQALEPLADAGPRAALDAMILAAEILAALGAFTARNPNVPLSALRGAAAITLTDLRRRHEEVPIDDVEILRSPQVVLLEAAEMVPLRRARSAGRTEAVLRSAAHMILELWELAVRLRQSPEPNAGELSAAVGGASPALEKILCELALGCALGEVAQGGIAGGAANQAPAR